MKYEMIPEHGMFRIKALKTFNNVKEGDLGGLIEKENNLSQEGICWVYKDALISGNARIYGNAMVFGDVQVFGDAEVCGNALVFGYARISGNAMVFGDAEVFGDAMVSGNAWISGNAKIYGNAVVNKTPFSVNRSDTYTFTLVKCTDEKLRVIAGCHYFTFEEAYQYWNNKRQGTDLQKETIMILKYLEGCAEIY